jgi:hypothetical protein
MPRGSKSKYNDEHTGEHCQASAPSMLVVFSLGLWIFSVISDFIFLLGVDAGRNDVAICTLGRRVIREPRRGGERFRRAR